MDSKESTSTSSSEIYTPLPMGTGGARPKVPSKKKSQKKPGRRGRTYKDISEEDKRRLKEMYEERVEEAENILDALEHNETPCKSLLRGVLHHQPGLIFDMLARLETTLPGPGPSPNPRPGPHTLRWCTCLNCRDMPTDIEKVCCRQPPEQCVSNMAYITYYVLEEGVLRLARTFWNDMLALRDTPEPGEEMRQFRHAAYRQYVMWQNGRLRTGNRVVVPSCCVWRIRDKYPDLNSNYTGFKVSRIPVV